jgi:hypothetical protein
MNSVQGLTDRINSRNDRLKELSDLSALDRPGRYAGEIEALTADREALRARYGEQIGGGRGVVNPGMPGAGAPGDRVVRAIEDLGKRPIKVYLDGREIASQVDEQAATTARRK